MQLTQVTLCHRPTTHKEMYWVTV